MSKQVDFYILEKGDRERKHHLVCKLTEKAVSQGLKVFVRAENSDIAQDIDRRLWVFDQQSFIPHSRVSSDPLNWQDYPVQIGEGATKSDPLADIVINLEQDVHENLYNYSRIVELVVPEGEERQAGRQRFRQYKEKGYEPSTHNIR